MRAANRSAVVAMHRPAIVAANRVASDAPRRSDERSRTLVQLLHGSEKNSSIFHGADIACPAVWNIMAKDETIFAEGV